MVKLAANLSMLFNEHDFLDRFDAAAKAGFKGVEFLFPYAHDKAELADRLKSAGLVQVLHNMPPGNWDEGERGIAIFADRVDEFREGVRTAIGYANALDCRRLHCMAGLLPEGADPEPYRETYVENLRWAANEAAEHGITVLIEAINSRDIPGYFLNTSAQAMAVLADVGLFNLRFQYDIYHMQIMEGDLARTIERNLANIGHMQLADTPGRHEPGTGEINYPFLFSRIDALGYDGWIGCEYHPESETQAGLDWAKPYLAGQAAD